MPTYAFPRITAKATRKGKCPICSKPTIRYRTFEQTVSPFNTNPDGSVRTHLEVGAAVRAECVAWDPADAVFEHEACAAAVRAEQAANRTQALAPTDGPGPLPYVDMLRDVRRKAQDAKDKAGWADLDSPGGLDDTNRAVMDLAGAVSDLAVIVAMMAATVTERGTADA